MGTLTARCVRKAVQCRTASAFGWWARRPDHTESALTMMSTEQRWRPARGRDDKEDELGALLGPNHGQPHLRQVRGGRRRGLRAGNKHEHMKHDSHPGPC
jgi:hypothetical protein